MSDLKFGDLLLLPLIALCEAVFICHQDLLSLLVTLDGILTLLQQDF